MTDDEAREQLLRTLQGLCGQWSEEGQLCRLDDGTMVLRSDEGDKSLAMLESHHLRGLVIQVRGYPPGY